MNTYENGVKGEINCTKIGKGKLINCLFTMSYNYSFKASLWCTSHASYKINSFYQYWKSLSQVMLEFGTSCSFLYPSKVYGICRSKAHRVLLTAPFVLYFYRFTNLMQIIIYNHNNYIIHNFIDKIQVFRPTRSRNMAKKEDFLSQNLQFRSKINLFGRRIDAGREY